MIDPNQMGPGGAMPPPAALQQPAGPPMGPPGPQGAPPMGPPGMDPGMDPNAGAMPPGPGGPPDFTALDPDAALMAIGEILAALGMKAKMQDQALDTLSQIIEAARGAGAPTDTLDQPAGTESQALMATMDDPDEGYAGADGGFGIE